MNEARQFLLEYYPGTDPIWLGGEAHGEHRVDVFFTGSRLWSGHFFYVASLKIEASFIPDVVSVLPHIPYETRYVNGKPPYWNESGVFVRVEEIYSVQATQIQFTRGGVARIAPVIGNHLVLFDWDTGWGSERPAFTSLLIDGTWVPTASSFVSATADDFVRAYIDHYESGFHGDDWANVALDDTDGALSEKIQMIELILDGVGPSHRCLGYLAAGPVENLISHELLDYVMRSPRNRERWVPLLRMTYWSSEPPDVQRRLRELLGVP